jgi:L,D-peptidoglycan transpeptidase YkuD (ErfK/YbiS/YcfS/YnhG family)
MNLSPWAAGAVAAVLAAAVTGCSAAGPSLAPSEPTPRLAVEGPCHALAEGTVRFETAGADRVVFAVADRRADTEVELTGCVRVDGGYAQEWSAPGYVGEGGFGPPEVTEMDTLKTPTGSYTMTEGFGREDPGTALDYRTLNPDSRWGGRRGPTFNQYFEGRGGGPDENLWELMESGLYEQAVVINFNRPPDAVARYGLSYAIFLHAGLTESWGCVSTDLGTVTRVLRNATPGDRIVMGAVHDVFREDPAPPSTS